MTHAQFEQFKQQADRLLAHYPACLHNPARKESLDLQINQLIGEYAPGTLFEKRLAVQESHVVLASALDFYKTLLSGSADKD
jgi:hypothetical protein